MALVIEAGAIAAEQIVHRVCTVGERHDLVVDAGAADVALDQTGVALVVLDHDDGDWLAHESLFRLLAVQLIGRVIVNVLPLLKFRGNRHGSTEPPHQRPDMGKPDALSRLVLGSGAAEQVENALVVLGIDAAAIVGDLEDRKAELGPAADRDFAGNAGLEIFERVVDQIREDLLQRQAVADDVRQRLDVDLGLGLGGLMRHRGDDGFDQFAGIDPAPARTRAGPRG